jgi:hypothetical protein
MFREAFDRRRRSPGSSAKSREGPGSPESGGRGWERVRARVRGRVRRRRLSLTSRPAARARRAPTRSARRRCADPLDEALILAIGWGARLLPLLREVARAALTGSLRLIRVGWGPRGLARLPEPPPSPPEDGVQVRPFARGRRCPREEVVVGTGAERTLRAGVR